ncbi:MAG TPA: response regulator [Propionibacteriaceae bacterium]|nr:response regulator [Propionibacteriaceae bacterium]
MRRSNAALRWYVPCSALGIAVYFSLPHALQNLTLIASNLAALIAILYSWRARRLKPTSGWLLLASFPAATGVGNTVYFVNDSILKVDPFPSLGDAAFLTGYVLLAAGLLRIQHARASGRDVSGVLDAAIVTVGFAAASWVYFMAPVLNQASSLIERLAAVGYPVGDVLVLAVAARFFFTARRRGSAFSWLAGTVVIMLVADTAFATLNVLGAYDTGHPVDALILAYNLGWGAVALHRDAGDLTTPPTSETSGPSLWRLAALTAASLIPATVLLIQVIRGSIQDVPVVAAAGLLLFLLVMARMTALVRALETALAQRGALEKEVAASTVELNRIASIVTSSGDAIVGLSLDGVVTSWNPAAEQLYGCSAEDAINRRQAIVSPEQFELFHASLDSARRSSETGIHRVHVVRGDDSTVPVEMTISPILDSDTIIGLSIIGQDVTERERAEAALKAARAAALEASRLKSEFLATMSHEIRTPMNGVIGLAELLLKTPLDEGQRQYAEGVQTASHALLTVINDILDFSKLEAGKVDLELIDFDPRKLVDEVGTLLARSAEVNGLELLAYCVPSVPAILHGDAGRIRQILLNLASNAVKFTSAGEVTIRLHTSIEPEGCVSAHFEITDTGIGIPAESQHRLFHSFSQADSSTTRRYGGTGLGLAISRRLVEAMGGEIGLSSEVGVGSRFWFRLPLQESTSTPDQPDPDQELPAGLRVLVVDDNATNRLMLSAQLQSWHLDSDLAADGYRALALLHQAAAEGQPYDIAVLDMGMPEMDGLLLAQAISADQGLQHTRMIMLNSALQINADAFRKAGVRNWLSKPVATSALLNQLKQLLGPPPPPSTVAPARSQLPPSRVQSESRILVVEDNALNQLVAEGVVVHLGYQPHIVTNGVEALEALKHSTYAAVLMDCHMPVMDGYEATREIRRLEGNTRHTPVIAMTASAMTQDRERALAAGMDDYVSKPIVPEAMADLLARWTSPGPPVAEPSWELAKPEQLTAGPGARPVLNQQRLDALRHLGDLKGVTLVDRMIELYSRDSAASLAAIRNAVQDGDSHTLQEAAHKMKGSASNVGAQRVAALCQQLESGAGILDPLKGVNLVNELESESGLALSALDNHQSHVMQQLAAAAPS